MKKIKLSILVIALLAVTVTSCDKYEKKYSCDSATNEWVKSNLKTIQKMNRQDLLELDFEKIIPAYRAFTATQKYESWVDKLEQVRNMQWTESELKHIIQLSESIEEDWFNENSSSLNLDDFLMRWVVEGMDFFGWSLFEVGCMISTLYDVDMEDDDVTIKAPNWSLKARYSCSCSTKSWNDFCPIGHGCSSSVACNESFGGCGWFWIQDCVGRCRP